MDAVRAVLEVEREVYGRCSPEAVETERLLVVCMHEQGRLADAEPEVVQTWQECIEALGPGHAVSGQALWTLVNVYDILKQPERVGEFLAVHLDRSRSRDTNAGRIDRYAWYAVRSPGLSPELYDMALATAKRGVETAPEYWSLWNTYAVALYRVGRYEEALAAVERAMEFESGTPEMDSVVRAMTLFQLGREDEAMPELERTREALRSRSTRAIEALRLLAEAEALVRQAPPG